MTTASTHILLAVSLWSTGDGITCEWVANDESRLDESFAAVHRYLTTNRESGPPGPTEPPIGHPDGPLPHSAGAGTPVNYVDLYVEAQGRDDVYVVCESGREPNDTGGQPGPTRPWHAFVDQARQSVTRRSGL